MLSLRLNFVRKHTHAEALHIREERNQEVCVCESVCLGQTNLKQPSPAAAAASGPRRRRRVSSSPGRPATEGEDRPVETDRNATLENHFKAVKVQQFSNNEVTVTVKHQR